MIPVIVQARTSSRRLPGKVLMPWGETTLLGRILRQLEGLTVWVATSNETSDDALTVEALAEGAYVFRGSLADVLHRFADCVSVMPERPQAVIRVCADRPFINRPLLDAMIDYWEAKPGLTLLAPKDVSTSGEIISVKALLEANKWAVGRAREHVTEYTRYHYDVTCFPTAVDTSSDYITLTR